MKYYVVDVFTKEHFHGNPAGVCLVEEALETSLMQNIAAENNLAETAFLVKSDEGVYDLSTISDGRSYDLK